MTLTPIGSERSFHAAPWTLSFMHPTELTLLYRHRREEGVLVDGPDLWVYAPFDDATTAEAFAREQRAGREPFAVTLRFVPGPRGGKPRWELASFSPVEDPELAEASRTAKGEARAVLVPEIEVPGLGVLRARHGSYAGDHALSDGTMLSVWVDPIRRNTASVAKIAAVVRHLEAQASALHAYAAGEALATWRGAGWGGTSADLQRSIARATGTGAFLEQREQRWAAASLRLKGLAWRSNEDPQSFVIRYDADPLFHGHDFIVRVAHGAPVHGSVD